MEKQELVSLLEKNKNLIFNTAYKISKNKESALEISGIALSKIYANISYYENSMPFEIWLLRIVVNSSINYVKKTDKSAKNRAIFLLKTYGYSQKEISEILVAPIILANIKEEVLPADVEAPENFDILNFEPIREEKYTFKPKAFVLIIFAILFVLLLIFKK